MGKEPERRHSSYYPTSSLARTPSHGAEYSKYRGNNKIAVEQSQNNTKNSEYLNPINILGIPATTARRSSQDRPSSGVSAEGGGPPASRSNSSTAGRLGGGCWRRRFGSRNRRISYGKGLGGGWQGGWKEAAGEVDFGAEIGGLHMGRLLLPCF